MQLKVTLEKIFYSTPPPPPTIKVLQTTKISKPGLLFLPLPQYQKFTVLHKHYITPALFSTSLKQVHEANDPVFFNPITPSQTPQEVGFLNHHTSKIS